MVQLLYVIASIHTLLCPFTKVEESFNIQAAHDILYHRHNLSEYDHHEFPGVVPRTFIGSLVISALSAPTVLFFHIAGLHKFWMQYVVRLALALTVIGAWSRLKNTLQKLYGNSYIWWFTLLTVTQYHFMFYMSRPLPNIMAMPLVLLAYDGWLTGKQKQFLISAGASIIIFRSELAMLFGLFLIMDLYFKRIELVSFLKIVIPAGFSLIALTVIVDSIFWGRLLWPEAEVFWYNTVMNKSSDWGTSPFLWYFYSALPRGLGPSLLLIPLGLYLDKRMVQVAAPAFVYILLYSLLPHKELRFIIYVFPLLNMASAAACSYVYIRRTKGPIYELLFWGQIMVVLGNIIMTIAFVFVAMTNYPGGVAISRLHKILRDESYVHVHIGNLAAQTGVTRFAQINDDWKYSKNESLSEDQLQIFTHLLIEAKSKYSPNIKALSNTHEILDVVESFSHISMTYKIMPPLKIKTRPAIFLLQRKDFREDPAKRRSQTIESSFDEENLPDEVLVNVVEYNVDDTSAEFDEFDYKENEEDREEIIEEVIGKEDVEIYEKQQQEEEQQKEEEEQQKEELQQKEDQELEQFQEELEDVPVPVLQDVIDDIPEVKQEEVVEPAIKPKYTKAKRSHDEPKVINEKTEPDITQKYVNTKKSQEELQPESKAKYFKTKKPLEEVKVVQEEIDLETPQPKFAKAKKPLEELKVIRQERKKKAIQKIKSETRKEVVASAKEKLREIMKRHKHIAEELSETVVSKEDNVAEKDSRGDIPEETIAQVELEQETQLESSSDTDTDVLEELITHDKSTARSNENVDSIVEEVIVRLLDKKIYDDKTKPEDIKAEDRLFIQKIVEEVLAERMNYTKNEQK